MKSRKRMLIVTFLVLLSGILFLYSKNNKGYNHEYILLTSQEYLLQNATIETYYEEPIGFGPHQVKVDLIWGDGERRTLVEDKIYNDGSNLSQRDIGIERLDKGIEITLRGSEQEDEVYEVSLRE